jgi:hypothetical protein
VGGTTQRPDGISSPMLRRSNDIDGVDDPNNGKPEDSDAVHQLPNFSLARA